MRPDRETKSLDEPTLFKYLQDRIRTRRGSVPASFSLATARCEAGVAVQGDRPWDAMLLRRPGKEPLGGRDVPPSAQEKIDGAARFIHGAIEVDPVALMPCSAIIWTRSRELSLKVRYNRTQSTMISRSKRRPLKSSCAEVGSVIAGR